MLCETASEASGLARVLSIAEGKALPETQCEQLLVLGVLFKVLLSNVTDPAPVLVRARQVVKRAIEEWSKPAPLPPRAERAANIIAARATEALDIDSIAQEIGCDVTLLRRDFKRRFGTSMREYHVRARVQVVLRLIAGGCGSNSDIGQAAGYDSEKNFYRAIRKMTGLRPSELRALSADRLDELALAVIQAPRVQPRAMLPGAALRDQERRLACQPIAHALA
jgi:AraC-like DNA-binding protein